MANKYPLIFNSDLGLIQEVTSKDVITPDNIKTTNLVVTGTIAVPGGGSLDALRIKSFGISNDPTVYTGTGSIVENKLVVSGISTSRFLINQKVKILGITSSTDSAVIPATDSACSFDRVGNMTSGTTYRYWVAQYHYRNGKIGTSTQATPTAGLAVTAIGDFNDVNHIALTLQRTSVDHGLLIYRSEDSTSTDNAKLVAILGPKELGVIATSGINWKDYGPYEKTKWSPKTAKNEFDDTSQIHFPNTATLTTSARKGWAIDTITAVGSNSITVSGNYTLNSNNSVKVIHDNTFGFKQAIGAAVSEGISSLILPSGTYYTESIVIPNGFALKGEGKNTIIKKQFFADDTTDGGGNTLTFDGNLIGIAAGVGTLTDITLQSLTIDGNNANNILFLDDDDNYLVNLVNTKSSLISDVEIRNSPASGLYTVNSDRLAIQNSQIVDGSLTDRYPFSPVNAQNSEVLRINNSLFQNYPGALDLSVTSISAVNGNVVRNCGTGIRLFSSGKFTTSGNIILGPADEFIPTNDLFDSDFNSVNLGINTTVDFTGPVMLYNENGLPKNLDSSLVAITAGIGTIINLGLSNESLGTRFMNFNIPTPNTGTFGRSNGYIQLKLNLAQTSTLAIGNTLGYDVRGTEYLDVPVGFTTFVGIGTGAWNIIGAGATMYTVTLATSNQFSAFAVGDIVKLANHSVTPDLGFQDLTVAAKLDVNSVTKQLRLTGFTTDSQTNGTATGYITVRNTFLIAKGRIGVT